MRYRRIAVILGLALSVAATGVTQQQRPRARQQVVPIPADVEVIRDVEYGKGGDVSLKLDILRPKTQPKCPMPVIVFVHGGSWKGGDKQMGLIRLIPFVQKGYFGVTINYRLTGIAPFPAQIEDCKCAIRWVRAHAKEYSLDADHIGIWGTSAGGHLVALLGTSGGVKELEGKGGWPEYSSKVQAVVDYFGPTDFLYWADEIKKSGITLEAVQLMRPDNAISKLFGGPFTEKTDVAKVASPTTYIDKGDPPVFIGHGENDLLVPLSQSQVFHEKLKAAGVEATLRVVKGQGHGFRDSETDQMVAEFFDKHLKSPPKPALAIPDDVEVIHDVEYGKGGDVSLKLDIVRPKVKPKGPMPAVIYVHGGGFMSGNKGAGIRRLIPLAQRGFFCATVEYRLTGVAPFPAQIEDCKCAVRWIRAHAREYGVDTKRIGAWGASAGGTLVSLLGVTGGVKELEGTGGWSKESSKVQAVCDWYGRMDIWRTAQEEKARGVTTETWAKGDIAERLSALVGGPMWDRPDACNKASPITYVSKGDAPFLIMHGDKDETVPLNQSEEFDAALRSAGVESTLVVVKGAGHGWTGRPDLDKAVVEFFEQHLR